MSLPTLLNLMLYLVVAYCVIVRLNMLHGAGNFIQRVSMVLILAGSCFEGLAPLTDGYGVPWHDLFMPTGLALFYVRYVHKVEKFYETNVRT